MNATPLLLIVLTVVAVGITAWAVTCTMLRRRIGELERESARLQDDIHRRMDLLQQGWALKRHFVERTAWRCRQALGDRTSSLSDSGHRSEACGNRGRIFDHPRRIVVTI